MIEILEAKMHSKIDKNQHLIVLNRGEDLLGELKNYCLDQEIFGAKISGIGALHNVELGFYDLAQKSYQTKNFGKQEFELISLNGNVSQKSDGLFVHLHVSLSDDQFRCFGGHLISAQVAVTVEAVITQLKINPQRSFNKEIGLDLIDRFE